MSIVTKTSKKQPSKAEARLTKRSLSGVSRASCLSNYLNAPPTITEKIANQPPYYAATSYYVVESLADDNTTWSSCTPIDEGWDRINIDLEYQGGS